VVADGSVRRVAKLPGAAPAKVADLLEAFAFERDVLGPTRSLRELARLLVDPLEHDLEAAERLLVIPHDVLHAVPFHALMDPSGRPLLERMPISYAPSGAIALHARDRLGRADPATGSLGFAVDVLPYIALPRIGAAEELAAVADTVPGLESYAGRAAVRRQLLTRAGTFEVLHLACHGEFDPADALLSRLYLADGPVYGYELLASAARARLVVLSACDSGVQGRYPGDELYGLVRAFVASGAIGVVSTLWAVPDDSSGELMKAFYGSWREGRLAPADALRVAQLDLYRSEAHRHPRYWAPYLLIGS